MELREIDAAHPDAEKLDRLNREAFPDSERIDAGELFAMAARGEAVILGIYEDERFAGFFSLRTQFEYIYMMFMAVCPELRSKGIGGKALRALRERYKGTQIAIDFESPDETSDNSSQRKRRKEFYLRSGFRETGVYMFYDGTEFEVVCSEEEFDMAGFERMMRRVHELSPAFKPRIYTKRRPDEI